MRPVCCLLISLAIFCSCKKSNGGNPTPPKNNETVYISGYCWDSLASYFVPLYWEDTTAHFIPGVSGNSYARAIAWSNNELFIAGQAKEWIPTGGLWVNGVSKDLGLGDTAAISDVLGLYVSGNDIYLAGFGVNNWADYGYNTYAKIWKNGAITNLEQQSRLFTGSRYNRDRPGRLYCLDGNKN